MTRIPMLCCVGIFLQKPRKNVEKSDYPEHFQGGENTGNRRIQ